MSESGEEWELSKENIRPITQGRKQKALKVALAPHPEEVISQQRQSFENELRTYSGDDPLFVWCKYIKWVEQNFPKGGKDGHIKQLMERCLSILKDEPKYFDDDRFIDIMLKYAGLSGKPLEMYNYMYSNSIGCKSAKFFINWSWELEQIGNLKKADEVLTEGVHRKAEPFEKMKSYYTDFEIRLATKIKTSVETNNSELENNRSAFAVLKPQKKNLAPILRIGEAVIEKKSSLILNGQQPQPRSIKSSTRVPFKIYDSENINPSLPIQTHSGARNYLNPENCKENERKPSKWNKVKMKSHNFIQETNPDFKFHCDEEKDEQLCTPRSVPKTSNILSSRRRTPSPPIALFEPPDPMKRPMYPKNKVYGGAEEYSLEEIRAAEWFERKRKAEKEMLLAEQQKKIEEQAKKEVELMKKVEYLAKKVEMLENHVTSGGRPCNILPKSDVNSGELDFVSINNQKEKSIENAEGKTFSQSNSNVESFRSNSAAKKNIDTSAYHKTDRMIQEMYNKSLHHTADDASSQSLDLNAEFDRKCSMFTSNKNTLELSQSDQRNVTKQYNEELPFDLYYDPTTKIIPDSNDIVSSKEAMDAAASKDLSKLNSVSEDFDKQSFFKDHTNISLKPTNQTEKIQTFSENSDYKIPFTFYADPTENIPAVPYKTVSSKDVLNKSNFCEGFQVDEAYKPANELDDLPFVFYHDPTNVTNIPLEKCADKEYPHQELQDEDSENIPPKGYIQDKTKRELVGILEPSKNIPYIPLEEQELEEEDDDSDFEDFIYPEGRLCADETLIPPSNTEQFSTAKFLASTPCVNKPKKGTSSTKSNQVSSNQIISQNFSNPSEILSDNKKHFFNENTSIKPESKTHKESGLNSELKTTCHSRLPNILSVIMETSENYSKSSSSSSSASLTKSNHLDQNSAYHINVYKQHSKFEPREPSLIRSISENANRVKSLDIQNKVNEEESEVREIFSVDFDPFDPKVIQKLLKSIKLDHYKNICNSGKSIKAVRMNENVKIGNDTYEIENLIAEGAYAKVYKAKKISESFEMYDASANKPLALKVCKKANEWEFYICSEIQKRLSEKTCLPDVKDSVMNIITAIKYTDGLLLVNEYSSLGTLLDVINFFKKQNSPIPELLIMFFTLQILHIVAKLHEHSIIHGDIKPDNFLLTSINPGGDILDNISKSTKCLRLIDFGRAIDLNLFDKGVCFTTTFSANDFKCNEMKEQKPWVFQLDWYGVLSCIHTLLFQEYMRVTKKDDAWKIEKKFKRYWHTALWEPLFNKLLNIPKCYEEPDVTFFINMIESKLHQNASNFISQLSRFSDSYSKNR